MLNALGVSEGDQMNARLHEEFYCFSDAPKSYCPLLPNQAGSLIGSLIRA